MLNEIDRWTFDEVILAITTNNLVSIHGGIIDRATLIPILQPDKEGFKEILQIHIAKIEGRIGKSLFTKLHLDTIAARLKDGNISGRNTRDLLEGVYAFSKQNGQEITTDSFLALLDLISPQRRIGFHNS